MDFKLVGKASTERLQWFSEGIIHGLSRGGHRRVSSEEPAPLEIRISSESSLRAFRRTESETFVVTVYDPPDPSAVGSDGGYALLIGSLSNLLVSLSQGESGQAEACFVTPEQGRYLVERAESDASFFQAVVDRILPLASCRPVVRNVHHLDLPEELWEGNEATASISEAGRTLGEMGFLPPARSLTEFLVPEDREGVVLPYGAGGISYGNLSARAGPGTFWMSASGVDKTRLETVGTDLLLVKDFDPIRDAMIVSIPPFAQPRRVSVDAIEHWMIYREHPEVGGILHVHAWMKGVPSTEINYPCGTYELAVAVAEVVRAAGDPSVAVVGLRNHGLTILGPSLGEILERVGPKLFRPVPMY